MIILGITLENLSEATENILPFQVEYRNFMSGSSLYPPSLYDVVFLRATSTYTESGQIMLYFLKC